MKVNFEQVKGLIEVEDLIIHCDTEEKANDLLKKLHEEGYCWDGGGSLRDYSNYSSYDTSTCYHTRRDREEIEYSGRDYFYKTNAVIYKYEPGKERKEYMKIDELVEGVEYGVKDSKCKFRVISGVLEIKRHPDEGCGTEWIENHDTYNYIKSLEFVECEFEPEQGMLYWYADPSYGDASYATWSGCAVDKNRQRNLGVFRTKEQAIQDAKERGWQ